MWVWYWTLHKRSQKLIFLRHWAWRKDLPRWPFRQMCLGKTPPRSTPALRWIWNVVYVRWKKFRLFNLEFQVGGEGPGKVNEQNKPGYTCHFNIPIILNAKWILSRYPIAVEMPLSIVGDSLWFCSWFGCSFSSNVKKWAFYVWDSHLTRKLQYSRIFLAFSTFYHVSNHESISVLWISLIWLRYELY